MFRTKVFFVNGILKHSVVIASCIKWVSRNEKVVGILSLPRVSLPGTHTYSIFYNNTHRRAS